MTSHRPLGSNQPPGRSAAAASSHFRTAGRGVGGVEEVPEVQGVDARDPGRGHVPAVGVAPQEHSPIPSCPAGRAGAPCPRVPVTRSGSRRTGRARPRGLLRGSRRPPTRCPGGSRGPAPRRLAVESDQVDRAPRHGDERATRGIEAEVVPRSTRTVPTVLASHPGSDQLRTRRCGSPSALSVTVKSRPPLTTTAEPTPPSSNRRELAQVGQRPEPAGSRTDRRR